MISLPHWPSSHALCRALNTQACPGGVHIISRGERPRVELVSNEFFDLFAAVAHTYIDCEILFCDMSLHGFPSLPDSFTLSPAPSPPSHFLAGSALVPSFFCLFIYSLSDLSHSEGQTLNNANTKSSTAKHLLSTHSVPGPPCLLHRDYIIYFSQRL